MKKILNGSQQLCLVVMALSALFLKKKAVLPICMDLNTEA